MPYTLFYQKWALIEGFVEAYRLDPRAVGRLSTAPKIDLWDVKVATRPPQAARADANGADEAAKVDQTFAAKLKGERDEFKAENIKRMCQEFNRLAPSLGIIEDHLEDNFSLVALARHLAGVAKAERWDGNDQTGAATFATSLRNILTGTGRISKATGEADEAVRLRRRTDKRGIGAARAEDDPRRYKVGEHFELSIDPPKGTTGTFDIYMWQSWNPYASGTRRFPWDFDDTNNPTLRPLPVKEAKFPGEVVLFSSEMVNDTGPGWHYLDAVAVRQGTPLAAKCAGHVAAYRRTAGARAGTTYDLATHLRILREIHFFLGERNRDQTAVFFGHAEFELDIGS